MFSKISKTPPLTENTKLLCFDLEANGLHGDIFAVGAIVMDKNETIHDEFVGRTKIIGPVDPFVEKNIVPVIKDMNITYASYKALRKSFWNWFVAAQEKADYVLVSNGYPVEYRFLLKCQEDDLENRYWQHPFPILDLTSLVLSSQGSASKNKLVADIVKTHGFRRHHPVDDAKISALAAFETFKVMNRHG